MCTIPLEELWAQWPQVLALLWDKWRQTSVHLRSREVCQEANSPHSLPSQLRLGTVWSFLNPKNHKHVIFFTIIYLYKMVMCISRTGFQTAPELRYAVGDVFTISFLFTVFSLLYRPSMILIAKTTWYNNFEKYQ